jgi:hypothetical protein
VEQGWVELEWGAAGSGAFYRAGGGGRRSVEGDQWWPAVVGLDSFDCANYES